MSALMLRAGGDQRLDDPRRNIDCVGRGKGERSKPKDHFKSSSLGRVGACPRYEKDPKDHFV